MASKTPHITPPRFSSTASLRDTPADRNVEAAIEAARQAAFATSVDTFKLLAGLPDAYLRAQRREFKRLSRVAGDHDPRVVAMRESMRHADRMTVTARYGQRRVERMLDAVASDELLVHGFVSDEKLEPVRHVRVQLTILGLGANYVLLESADVDGYFRFRTGIKGRTAVPVATDVKVGLSDGVAEALERVNSKADAAPSTADTAADRQVTARLEIFDPSGKTSLHIDPLPMKIQTDGVYREYVLVDGRGIGGTVPLAPRDTPGPTYREDVTAPAPGAEPAARATRSGNRNRNRSKP